MAELFQRTERNRVQYLSFGSYSADRSLKLVLQFKESCRAVKFSFFRLKIVKKCSVSQCLVGFEEGRHGILY